MAEIPTWHPPPSDLHLASNEVHLWCASLEQPAAWVSSFLGFLSGEERARVERFSFRRDADRFTLARGILRQILGLYTQVPPQDIQFATAAQGKPALHNSSRLRFNLSHSEDVALYALSWERELGVDVEYRRDQPGNQEVVKSFFSRSEQAEFEGLEPVSQETAFYLGWTRKEAYIKARGEGLHANLKSFDVSLTPGEPFLLTSEDANRWGLYSFYPKPGFVAALVVEGKNFKIRHWEWEGRVASERRADTVPNP